MYIYIIYIICQNTRLCRVRVVGNHHVQYNSNNEVYPDAKVSSAQLGVAGGLAVIFGGCAKPSSSA